MNTNDLQELCDSYAGRLPGGRLVVGSRFASEGTLDEWIGPPLVWVPDVVEIDRPFYAVASSRIGRHPHRRRSWFHLLERAVEASETDGAAMMVVGKTASAPWVLHACKRFQARAVEMQVASWGLSMDRWIDGLSRKSPVDRIEVSPPVDRRKSALSRRDAAVMVMASRVFVPLVTRGGNVDQLVRKRLADTRFQAASVWVDVDDGAESEVSRELIDLGAVGWMSGRAASLENDRDVAAVDGQIGPLDELLSGRDETSDEASWPYLVHCTRERLGRWPGQTEESFRDELLLGGQPETGALGTLKRILRQQRLIGDSRVTRGDTPVVCFTNRVLSDLLDDRVYRSHLGRWDWEPYGIAIRRNVLEESGCRRVVYGDHEAYGELVDAEKPFYQSEGTRQDWTLEKEWRMRGSVDLSGISAEDAFVFVATVEDGLKIQPLCRWPIVVARV